MDFRWVSGRRIAVGSRPSGRDDVERLRLGGVRAVLSLVRLGWTVSAAMREAAMSHVTEELEDFGTPTMQQMDHLAAVIDAWLGDGRPVYVHCYMGIGRSRTIAAAYLAVRLGSVEAALDAVGLPETPAQRRFVSDYFALRGPQI